MPHIALKGITMKKPKHLKTKFKRIRKKEKPKYPSSLSQKRWRKIRHLFPRYQGIGRPLKWPLKYILDAIFMFSKQDLHGVLSRKTSRHGEQYMITLENGQKQDL